MADLRIAQGRLLRDAMRAYQQALQLAPEPGGPVLRGTADMYVGISALHRERDDLEVARQLLAAQRGAGGAQRVAAEASSLASRDGSDPGGRSDLGGALDLLDQAERLYEGDFSPNVRSVPALRARAWILQGRIDDAFKWARDQRLSVDDDLSYLREYEHVTLTRALLARYESEWVERTLDEATQLLERILRAADGGDGRAASSRSWCYRPARRMRGNIPAAWCRWNAP